MAGTIAFYQRIIESMNEGVMALCPKGRITMFNDPAGKILGLLPEKVKERPFGQVFMMEMEENDQFCQLIMDAVYENAVGRTATLSFKRPDGNARVLSLSTSYLRPDPDSDAETGGVVVVFTDITEITKSREKEEELNARLRNAFIDAEKTNQQLAAALKKVQWIRVFITFLVVLGFSGTGYYLWQKDLLPSGMFTATAQAPEETGTTTTRVMAVPISSSISLSGFVAPLEEVNVTAPYDGKIKERFFVYDQRVEKGAKLFTMDTDKLEMSFRDAKAAFIKAEQHYQELQDWEKSAEVANARRTFTRAKNSLDTAQRKLEESRVLFEKGIISGSEFESAQVEVTNQKLDFTAAKENLEAVQDKANAQNRAIAEMELANARANLEEIREKLSHTTIYAPVSGIIILPATGDTQGAEKKRADKGATVNQGDVLVSVGNLEGLSVRAKVDEIDIGKIDFGMKVHVTGDAFSDLPLNGRVRQISSNASSGGGGMVGAPLFDVGIAIDTLSAAQKARIRLGMSANLEIMVYHNPKALMVPLSAVEIRGNGKWVKKMDGGRIIEVPVETGMTTLDGVEIRSGLSAGDEVAVFPGLAAGDEAPRNRDAAPM